jgi:phosphate transport system permease protein
MTASLAKTGDFVGRGVKRVLGASAAVSVLVTAGIVLVLAFETFGFFRVVGFDQFFFDTQWTPLFAEKHFGIWPLLGGTLLTTAIAMCFALPLGLLAAVYLAEFAKPRVQRVVKPVLELLAGVPTVVFGYFALSVVTPSLQKVVSNLAGFNALGAGMVMGVMIMPLVASLSEDALRAVPRDLREASYALGADKVKTIFSVVIPAAFSGIAAATILAVSRAIGETMVVAIAAGQQPALTADPRVPVMTMTTYIVQVSLGDTPHGTIEYSTIFAVGATLFVLTLALNLLSHRLRRRILRGAA